MFKRIVMMVLFLVSFGAFAVPAEGAGEGGEGDSGTGDSGDSGEGAGEGGEGDSGDSGSGDNNEMIPKFRLDQEIDKKKHYKQEYEKMEKQYSELQNKIENMADPDEIKDLVEKETQEIKAKRVKDKKRYELRLAVIEAGANPDAVDDLMKVIDLDNYNFDKNNEYKLLDKENALETLQEQKSWAFPSEEEGGSEGDIGGGGNPPNNSDKYKEAQQRAKQVGQKQNEGQAEREELEKKFFPNSK